MTYVQHILTDAEVRERLKGVLEAAGIDIWFCGSLAVTFPDGAEYSDDGLIVEARGISHQWCGA
jgi:hypothetical protein